MSRFWIAIAIATVSLSPLTASPPVALGRQVSPSTPRELAKIRTEFARVREAMKAVQRDFDRAARTNAPAVRDQALKDWQRALDGVEPYAKQLSPTVPEEAALLDEYNGWLKLYADAAGTGNAGDFFLQITRHWSELTAGTEGWDQEQPTLTFDALAKADDNDANTQAMGLPKTVALVKAIDQYLTDVTAREDYLRYKGSENVKADLAQAQKAREEAQTKLATAANAVLDGVTAAKLDQRGRDRLERFVEQDMTAIAGSPAEMDLQTRGRTLVYDFDKKTLGEPAANEKAMKRLTDAATGAWPRILASYATTPAVPADAGRGQVVKISGVSNRVGKEFQSGTYDFAGIVDGAPVVGNFAPGVREHIARVFKQTNTTALPDVEYDLVAVVRGNAQVPAFQQRPGATTAPATADDAAATTSPAVTTCALLDIVALRAGPACVGTELNLTAEK